MGADAYTGLISTIRLDLLELLGRRYVVEHCVSAFNRIQEEKAYRIYVTDCLRALGYKMGTIEKAPRYADAIMNKTQGPEKTSEEIKQNIFEKLRRMGGER